MNKLTTKKLILPIVLTIITLLTFSCNTENDGVFYRISESVVKVDVGYVDLIMKDGTTLYSYTGKSGLQSYDTIGKTWSRIDSSQVMHYTTDGTNIVYASHAVGDTLNDINTYAPGNPGTTTEWATGYHVVAMNPQHNLMLIRDAEADFNVYPSDNSTPTTPVRGTATTTYAADLFSDTLRPRIIASGAGEFIVSGRSNDGT